MGGWPLLAKRRLQAEYGSTDEIVHPALPFMFLKRSPGTLQTWPITFRDSI